MANLSNIIKLTESQYNELVMNGSITVNNVTYNFDENAVYLVDSDVETRMELLWANPNPSGVAFPSQTITVPDLTQYDYIQIASHPWHTSTNLVISTPLKIITSGGLCYSWSYTDDSSVTVYNRRITINSATSITIGPERWISNANGWTTGQDNEALVPIYIYGCKGSTYTNADSLLRAYPIGSIYISYESTSPASLFGGTWEQIKGRFLLGEGSNVANTNSGYGSCPAGTVNRTALCEMGGEASHTLDISEMPSHNHAITWKNQGSGGLATGLPYNVVTTSTVGYDGDPIGNTGGGGAHNNMPPYFVVKIWRRTA